MPNLHHKSAGRVRVFVWLVSAMHCGYTFTSERDQRVYAAGSALTTFNKGSDNLQPKVIALRSMQYTSGEMLYNPGAYAEFRAKVKINDQVRCSHVTPSICNAPEKPR